MSAPTAERPAPIVEVGEIQTETSKVAAEVLGRAAHGELMVTEVRRPNLEKPGEVEAFLADFVNAQHLKPETTGKYELPDGTEVRASRITSGEEVIGVEFNDVDPELGASGVVVDADRIENGSPYVQTGGVVLRVGATMRQPDGSLVVDRITDPDMKQYALARLADTLTAVADTRLTPEIAGESRPLHRQGFELKSALKARHTVIDLR